MKSAVLILTLLFLALGGLLAQPEGDYEVEMSVTAQPERPVYFGIYVEDLDPSEAREEGYQYQHGILITGIVGGSAADEAGLMEEDIMMEIDGQPIADTEEFDLMRAKMSPGQSVSIRVWREGEIHDLDLLLRSRPEGEKGVRKEIRKEVYIEDGPSRGKDLGWGGGSWVPYWFIFPVGDVNNLIDVIGDPLPGGKGFEPNAISGKGVFMNGGAGKGHIGNGIFIGGVGAGYEYKVSDPATDTSLRYEVSFGGATLEKRFLITPGFAASLGVMLGGGGHVVKYSQTQSSFVWPETFTDSNFTATLKREYFVVQPRAELLLRLVDWLALRAELGYTYGVPTYSGWKVESSTGDDHPINSSPNTPFQGLSFSIGPWIGF